MEGPPPAWVETRRGAFWLAYASYCWRTACADSAGPSCGEAPVPTLVVDRGEEIRFRLPFAPRTVELSLFPARAVSVPKSIPLPAEREPTWRVSEAGPFFVSAVVGEGRDASYTGCLELHGEEPPARAVSVEEALSSGRGEPLVVEGTLIVADGQARLCSAILESFPPQCGEPSLLVKRLDPATVPGLESAGGVSWSSGPVRLRGNVDRETLTVSATSAP